MTPARFDPFNNRLARDIRNTLSKSFLQALEQGNVTFFQRSIARYLQQELEPVFVSYISSRRKKYEEVFALIITEKEEDILQKAAIFWEYKLYFEMHELLEPFWKKAKGAERKALQGLIRAAGMKIHAENNNRKAAVSMGTKALAALDEYGAVLAGFSKRDEVREDVAKTLTAIRNQYT